MPALRHSNSRSGTARLLVVGLVAACTTAHGAGFRAGLARTVITPDLPFWLSGYASRDRPADRVLQDLWAKALAVEDSAGRRVVIVTTDLIGLPREVSDAVGARVARQYHLSRSQLLLNSSHTHCGPAVLPNLSVMFDLNPADRERAEAYRERLTSNLVRIVGEALADLAPAHLSTGHGSVGFAANRRASGPRGIQIGVNPTGPTDHDVPVVKVTGPDGNLRAVLFGYACHNTTLGGSFYQVNGDYAGFAQRDLEAAFPSTTALFLMLCGGDQNPNPRGTVELAEQHGHELATEVRRVLASQLRLVTPRLRTSYDVTRLAFAPHSRADFEAEARSTDRFRQRRAAFMLEAYARGKPVRDMPYPVQAIRFGRELTLLGLGGEVVVDYARRLKRALPDENLIIAGYCNEVRCYIPSRRVLLEGGYEPVDSMIYYGQPGPLREDVEECVVAATRRVMKRVGAAVSKFDQEAGAP